MGKGLGSTDTSLANTGVYSSRRVSGKVTYLTGVPVDSGSILLVLTSITGLSLWKRPESVDRKENCLTSLTHLRPLTPWSPVSSSDGR